MVHYCNETLRPNPLGNLANDDLATGNFFNPLYAYFNVLLDSEGTGTIVTVALCMCDSNKKLICD